MRGKAGSSAGSVRMLRKTHAASGNVERRGRENATHRFASLAAAAISSIESFSAFSALIRSRSACFSASRRAFSSIFAVPTIKNSESSLNSSKLNASSLSKSNCSRRPLIPSALYPIGFKMRRSSSYSRKPLPSVSTARKRAYIFSIIFSFLRISSFRWAFVEPILTSAPPMRSFARRFASEFQPSRTLCSPQCRSTCFRRSCFAKCFTFVTVHFWSFANVTRYVRNRRDVTYLEGSRYENAGVGGWDCVSAARVRRARAA